MAWMTILGLDWKGGRLDHPFDIVEVPHRGGVFKLHSQQPDGEWEVFFVGQAKNLYAALLAYLGTVAEGSAEAKGGLSPLAKERVAQGSIAVSYAIVDEEKDRIGCVKSLLEYFHPGCNDPQSVPDVADVGCNPF